MFVELCFVVQTIYFWLHNWIHSKINVRSSYTWPRSSQLGGIFFSLMIPSPSEAWCFIARMNQQVLPILWLLNVRLRPIWTLTVFGSFGNEPMQSCCVRRCRRRRRHLCTALPVTGLIIEASYLTNICSYAPSICTWNIKSMWCIFFKWWPF